MRSSPAPRYHHADGRVHGVVVACRRDDGRYLCIRRGKTVAAPLKVAFPGGAMEAGETQRVAGEREMLEEVGVAVKLKQCIWRWDSPLGELTLWGWTADAPTTSPMPNETEVAAVLWLTAAEAVDHPDAMPTMRAFVDALTAAETSAAMPQTMIQP